MSFILFNSISVPQDEPTSGLDARAAAIVMRTVRNTVNTGRTVVCTIHQPSIDIFEVRVTACACRPHVSLPTPWQGHACQQDACFHARRSRVDAVLMCSGGGRLWTGSLNPQR